MLWILGVIVYLTRFVGWENLAHLLPSEIAVVVLWLVLPFIVGGILYFVMEIVNKVDALAQTVAAQTGAMTGMVQQVTVAVDEARKSREIQVPADDLQALLARALSGAIEAHGGLQPLTLQSKALQNGNQVDTENLNPNDFAHLGTLINLFNVALNDLSVITTRLLVRLLDDTGRDKEEVRTFITGLLDAYGTGDKNVFFRALKQQLDFKTNGINTLKELAVNSVDVRRDVSKILREAEEIMAMVRRCDRQNLIRIVFEEGDLWGLQQELTCHFDIDGNLRM
ncbi:MAG: hypothetical protein HQL37_08840 [Alphaproteobacteria bacterium]|nr:hypothetical protein [Alphaproteobacteria bacterium]